MVGAPIKRENWVWLLGGVLALGACESSSKPDEHPVECGAGCSSMVSIEAVLPVPLSQLADQTVTVCRNGQDTCYSAQLGNDVMLGEQEDFGIARDQPPVTLTFTGTPSQVKVLLNWNLRLEQAKDGDRYSVRFGDDFVIDQAVTYNTLQVCTSTCKQAFIEADPPPSGDMPIGGVGGADEGGAAGAVSAGVGGAG